MITSIQNDTRTNPTTFPSTISSRVVGFVATV
jgi:hypothetical protein